ncbi:HAUS augmin-like complex subunit 5 [Suncus etruscus]|uniref:HAUS augmin-like complex subunit 5 n=1 Tax=Suncus etruscus TaxID=109475 RepID=UPI00210FBF56|nr:HAUS augmin-like complex subunit 5 [Suncus etruscus]
MDLGTLARELGRWATEEMRVPAAARPSESALRRLCLGQGADIWAYVVRHVHSQETVEKIRGNLLWYGHQDNSKARRKSELEATIARLRAEIQELDQNLEMMAQETETQDVALEQVLQKTQDTKLRALLLRAQAGAMQKRQQVLQEPTQELQNQLKHLQDMQGKAKVDITFGSLTSPTLGLEPMVLNDVRTACALRTEFLQNLLIPQAKTNSAQTHQDDHFGISYQQWLSSVETLLTKHPPGHILAALSHLAAEREAEIRALCSPTGPKDAEKDRSQVTEKADSSEALSSTMHLIQEGWRDVGTLVSQRGPLLKEQQILTRRLQDLIEEAERTNLGSTDRQAMMLGLQRCGLWAELKALRAKVQELEEAAEQRQFQLRELQAKQHRILSWRQLMKETQTQVCLLIKSNSTSKKVLCQSPTKVLSLVQKKLVPTSEMVAPQSQELFRCLEKEAQLLPHLQLGSWLCHGPEGLLALPTFLLSIHQLHPASPRGSSLLVLSHLLGLPSGKAPELLLPAVASLRQDLLFIQDQQSLRAWGLHHMKTSLPPGPSAQELLQTQASQEEQQKESLGHTLKQMEVLLKQAVERIPELKRAVEDWWEQPGQVALSGELCHGLSLSQWQLRWAQAQGTQQAL